MKVRKPIKIASSNGAGVVYSNAPESTEQRIASALRSLGIDRRQWEREFRFRVAVKAIGAGVQG